MQLQFSNFSSGVARGDQNSFAALREFEELQDRRSPTRTTPTACWEIRRQLFLDPTPAEGPVEFVPRDTQNVTDLTSLDPVNLREVFSLVLHLILHFLKGAFRGAVRVALKAVQGYQTHPVARTTQGWKLLMLLPRLLLHRPLRGGKVSRKRFAERFQEGRWTELLAESMAKAQKTHQTSIRRRHRQRDDGRQRQFDRAVRLAHMGELFARQALESADVAPGTLATSKYLDVYGDSDCAVDEERKRSTTGVAEIFGGHPLDAASATQ